MLFDLMVGSSGHHLGGPHRWVLAKRALPGHVANLATVVAATLCHSAGLFFEGHAASARGQIHRACRCAGGSGAGGWYSGGDSSGAQYRARGRRGSVAMGLILEGAASHVKFIA